MGQIKKNQKIKKEEISMAHHKSTIKRIRQTKKRTERNRPYRTRLKNISKAVNRQLKTTKGDSGR